MAEPEEPLFRVRPKHLLPIFLGLVATGILGFPLVGSGAATAPVTPFAGNDLTSASLDALILVLALAASATVMLLLIRRGRMKFIRQMIRGALIFVSFAVSFWYTGSVLPSPFDPASPAALLFFFGLSGLIAILIGVSVFGKGRIRQLFGVSALSSLTGVFLGYSIGLITALVLVGALVIYDIVAVFRGPVGALARTVESGDLPGAMFSYGELTIGMGDLVFYSLVATTALVSFGAIPFFGAAFGILIGTYLGLRALSRYEMFPGLPLSLLLGVVGMLLSAWLQGL
jgi:presenilin